MAVTPEILHKAAVLAEALPYINEFHGKTVVIKYGGSTLAGRPLADDPTLQDIVLMKLVGMHPVVVHGGGPEITAWLGRLGKKSEFVGGRRVTDAETAEIAEMVLGGKLNRAIVAALQQIGGRAAGLSGKDGGLLRAVKRMEDGPDGPVDLGFVGDVKAVDVRLVRTLIDAGYIPVIAPIGFDDTGATYNINADSVAGAVAAALGAHKLVLLTDVDGILRDRADAGSRISTLRVDEVGALIDSGVIAGGMLPKIEACVQALRDGVQQAHILDGRVPHALLLEIFTREGVGTMVLRGDET